MTMLQNDSLLTSNLQLLLKWQNYKMTKTKTIWQKGQNDQTTKWQRKNDNEKITMTKWQWKNDNDKIAIKKWQWQLQINNDKKWQNDSEKMTMSK